MLEPLIVVLGVSVTALEVVAFVLAFACVVLGVLEVHWTWPLAIASSLLYGWLFQASRLYGEAGLQLFFAVLAVWGWWQWVFGRAHGSRRGGARPPSDGIGGRPGGRLAIGYLGAGARAAVVGTWLAGWLALGALLGATTDSDVPYFDAFPTAGSVIGQVLLARKRVENWLVWLVVNVVATGLFASKQLWLTALLYALFAALALAGWRRWRPLAERAEGADA